MVSLRYMFGILIVFCYPFVFGELAHLSFITQQLY